VEVTITEEGWEAKVNRWSDQELQNFMRELCLCHEDGLKEYIVNIVETVDKLLNPAERSVGLDDFRMGELKAAVQELITDIKESAPDQHSTIVKNWCKDLEEE